MMHSCRILLINNDDAISRYLREELTINAGHLVSITNNSQAGIDAFKRNGYDVAIIKFGMADDMDGFSLIKELKKIDPNAIIIALVEEANPHLIKDIYDLGGYDFISQPINLEKLFFLIKKGMDLRSLVLAQHRLSDGLQEHNKSLQKQNTLLARRIEESTKNLTRLYEDLRQTYMRTIKVLAQAIDARDHYTHSHSENVAKYAVAIAEEMRLSANEVALIRDACELHDLGKIGVEDNILSKPSALTPQEWEQIKRHPQMGAQILEPLTFLDGVIDLVKQHHEHYDGKGYPEGRMGDDILLGARIIHVADAYEAMRSARSYRKVPLTKEEAVAEIKKHNGTQFDPKVVDAFLKIVDKL
ncbi:MAG: HD domain-containing protein [Candidatus Omnitrophica bacterium]|nr:HD domain-containing protein [Candidatus Omnitrophota bacterium]MDD5593034.1 HD domain-containing protein [Candidatus Omnitrophota bacterium]